jgi:hypothetical protein
VKCLFFTFIALVTGGILLYINADQIEKEIKAKASLHGMADVGNFLKG